MAGHCAVSIATDLSSGPTCHGRVFPWDVWDNSAPMDWTPGGWAGKHSLATSKPVKHKDQVLVLDEHDLGPALFHTPGTHGAWHLVGSSRKIITTAAKVRANGKALACTGGKYTLMVCGDPISLPTGRNRSNDLHTVIIGVTDLDELKGLLSAASSVCIDMVMFFLSIVGPLNSLVELSDEALGFLGLDLKKAKANAIAGLASSILISQQSGWKEPISVKFEIGNGWFSEKHELSVDPQSFDVDRKGERNLGGYKYDPLSSGSDWGVKI